MLEWVPPPDGPIELITVYDFERAADTLGVPRPSECSTDQSRDGYRDNLFVAGRRDGVLLPRLMVEVTEEPVALADSFGIEICEVAGAVEPNTPGDLVLQVTTDVDDVDRAVHGDPAWSERLTTAEYAGVMFYDWGDGIDTTFGERTPARPVGTAGQLAFVDQIVIRTRERAQLEVYLDAPGQSVLERRHVREAVALLEGSGAHSFVLTEGAYFFDPVGLLGEIASPESIEDIEADRADLLLGWHLLGLGASLDDVGDPVLVVVMAHSSNEEAEENVQRFTALVNSGTSLRAGVPWSEFLTLEDVAVEGSYLTARLHAVEDRPPLSMALNALFSRDSLFMIE